MMKKRLAISGLWAAAGIVLLSNVLAVSAEPAAARKARLFILSGQSNMAGLNPAISFTPAVTKAFAGDEIIVVKSAQGGQPIRRWYRKWQAPKGARVRPFTPGDLYDRLMSQVKKQVGARGFDTFASVTFVWMQGERDAKENLSAVYAESLRGLIAQLRRDIGRADMTVVIGRLSDCLNGNSHWDDVRAAQGRVAAGDPLAAMVDTDDLNGPGNALHYTKDGYKTLGQRFADAAVKLIASGGPAAAPSRNLKKDDRIVFLGDSITAAGVGPTGYVTLTAQVIAKVYPALNVKVIGAGISGHKVPDCQKRLDRDVIKKSPTIVVIYIGINDVWHWNRNRGTTKEDFASGLHDLIKRIRSAGARVILCTPTVIGEKTDGTNTFDTMLDEYSDISRKVAADTGCQLLDLRKLFMAWLKKHNKSNAARGVLTGDTVHLNEKGNRFLSGLVLGALKVPLPVPDLTKGGELETTGFYHLGPTGARGRMFVRDFMTRDARQILVTAVDADSPADGVLEAGDVILGIGDKRFTEDARKAFGRAITAAETEAAGGVLRLLRWRTGKAETVSLQLRVMGTFSETAPYDCAKSKRIMDEALRYLAAQKKWSLFSLEALAFLASGKPEYVNLVRQHLHEAKWARPDVTCGTHAWTAGYRNLVLTEYYLATGDKYVLPAIREYAVKTAMGQSGSGTWGHSFALPSMNGGRLHGRLGGYGELNAAGLPCFLSLVLARKCGVGHAEIDQAIARSTRFFSQFVDRGTIGYGFHRPSLEHYSNGRNGDSSNGKNATAAVVFSVMGKHDAARFFYKMVTSSYDEREYGHSGNSFHQFWGALGANCGGPKAVAAFARELQWYSALVRQADGSFAYQPLGGTYGGPALSATVAHVLANALPLRKIYITGKGSDPKTWLDDAGVKEAVDAGRWRLADCDKITADQLIEELDCWSPGAREWIAEALGEKEGNVVPQLLKLLARGGTYARAGACAALGYQGRRAAPAVGVLTKALSDKESIVRVTASYALMRIGEPARRAVPDMLRAILANPGIRIPGLQSMRPTQQAVAYSLGHKGGGTAPLYFTGMFADWPRDANPLDGLDRQVLYPAMAALLKHPSARVRGCAAYAFRYLSPEDVAAMAQDIYDATGVMAPAYAMFYDLPRNQGLDLMARYRLAEGVPLCLDTLDAHMWGKDVRFPNRFSVLQKYGGAAKSVLPRLKELRWDLKKAEDRELVERTIKAIESDTNPAELTRLADLVEKRLVRELTSAKSKQQRVDLCRKLMSDRPADTFLQGAGLRQLVSMLASGAADDILAAVEQPDERLRATALQLAADLPGPDVTARWIRQLAAVRGPKLAAILRILARRGDAKVFSVAAGHLKHEQRVVRVAAVEAVSALGGEKALPSLVGILAKADDEQERAAVEQAVVAACRSAGNVEESTAAVLAAVPNAAEAVLCSLIRVLGQTGGAKALAAVAAAAGDERPDVRKAALEVLATSPDPKATDILLALAEKARRGKSKTELLSACLRRVIIGRVPSQQRLSVLDRIVALGDRGSASRTALDELAWSPSAASLRMARSWMRKGDKAFGNTSEYAAKAAVAIARAMDMGDQAQRQAAIEAVKEVLTVSADEKTLAAAKTFIMRHGG